MSDVAPPPVISSATDVSDLINSGRARGGKSGAITFIALGGIFIDAYDFSAIAFGLKDIATTFGLSAVEEGVVAASIMVGALLGALVGGYLVDRIGRYRMFMADMVFFVVAALACAVAPNMETLIVARFLLGIGIGIDFPVALAFIAEFNALRGRSGKVSLWQPMWYFATGCSFLVLLPFYFLLPESAHTDLWRWAVGFGAVPALIVMLVRHRYMNESPAWAARQGDLHRAARILRDSYGITVTVDAAAPRAAPSRAGLREFGRIFRGRYRRRTILAAAVSMFQSIQYYAVGFALPVIIAALLAQGRLTSIIGPLIFNLVFGVLGGLLGVWLSSRLGSWKLATSGFAICLLALLGLGWIGSPQSAPLLVLVGALLGVFVFFHSYGPGAQGMTIATLSYPTSLRGVGSGFGQATLRVGSMVSLFFFPILSSELGTGVFFAVAAAPLLGLIVLLAIRWDPTWVDTDAEEAAELAAESSGERH